jgi:hypothetical protein
MKLIAVIILTIILFCPIYSNSNTIVAITKSKNLKQKHYDTICSKLTDKPAGPGGQGDQSTKQGQSVNSAKTSGGEAVFHICQGKLNQAYTDAPYSYCNLQFGKHSYIILNLVKEMGNMFFPETKFLIANGKNNIHLVCSWFYDNNAVDHLISVKENLNSSEEDLIKKISSANAPLRQSPELMDLYNHVKSSLQKYRDLTLDAAYQRAPIYISNYTHVSLAFLLRARLTIANKLESDGKPIEGEDEDSLAKEIDDLYFRYFKSYVEGLKDGSMYKDVTTVINTYLLDYLVVNDAIHAYKVGMRREYYNAQEYIRTNVKDRGTAQAAIDKIISFNGLNILEDSKLVDARRLRRKMKLRNY